MNFYICSTPYHIFVSLLHLTKNEEKGFFYLTTHDSNCEKIFNDLKKSLLENDRVEQVVIRKRNRFLDKIFIEKFKDYFRYPDVKKYMENSNNHIYNFCWNPYSLYFPSNYLYQKANSVSLIEEGSMLYAYPKPSKIQLFVKKNLYHITTNFNRDNKTKEILVQYPEKYPEFLQEKIRYFDLKNMIASLDERRKKDLFGVFTDKKDFVKSINHLEGSVIILTQPLSEDELLNEREKITIYKDIVNQYSSNYKVVLKRHPRERTIYNIEGVLELDGAFPSEILSISNIKFEKAIGLCTSAVHNINAKESFNVDEGFFNRRK